MQHERQRQPRVNFPRKQLRHTRKDGSLKRTLRTLASTSYLRPLHTHNRQIVVNDHRKIQRFSLRLLHGCSTRRKDAAVKKIPSYRHSTITRYELLQYSRRTIHANQDPRLRQKPIYFPVFTNNIPEILVLEIRFFGVFVVGTRGSGGARGL